MAETINPVSCQPNRCPESLLADDCLREQLREIKLLH